VEELIETIFLEQDATDADINDFLWFNRDEIAQHLGYADWDEYECGEETYKDINGVELAVSDEVHWHDEAGHDDDGSMITFTIVEDNGDGYFNLATEDEDNPEIDPVKTPEQYAALMRAVAERNRRVVEKLRSLG
jgi:hypothetical protein